MPVISNPYLQSKPQKHFNLSSTFISQTWEIQQWIRITKKHCIVSAIHRESNATQILILVPNTYYDKKLWKSLLRLPDDKLLVPERIYPIEQMHVLVFPHLTSLKELVRTKGMPLSQIVQLMQDLLDSLLCLHNHGIIHGDISTDNIYLTEDSQFILGDFSESYLMHHLSITSRHRMVSKKACQRQENIFSIRSELYQLGKLLYLLCNHGNPLPEGQTCLDLKALPIFHESTELSKFFSPILSKLLAGNTGEQYFNLLSIQQDLESLPSHCVEQSDYQLFLPEETHAFHQTVTSPDTNNHSNPRHHFLMLSFLLLTALTACILIPMVISHPDSAPIRHKNVLEENQSEYQISTGAATSFSPKLPVASQNILDLASRNLPSLSAGFPDGLSCENIYVLLAEKNMLRDLADIAEFPHLRELYLSNNQISDLRFLSALPDLEIAVLSDNCCTQLSGLSNLNKLLFLDLSGNTELTDVRELQNLKTLETIILSDTSVSEDSLEKLKQSLPDCNVIY